MSITTPPHADPEIRSERMVRLAMELMDLGVDIPVVRELLTYDLDVVERQLRWLPDRNARKPTSFIVAAIRNNYECPANFMRPSGDREEA